MQRHLGGAAPAARAVVTPLIPEPAVLPPQPPAAAPGAARADPDLLSRAAPALHRDRRAGLQRRGRPGAQRPPPARATWTTSSPSPRWSPSPTTRAWTTRGRSRAASSATCRGVRAFHLDQKGRGRALRTVWSAERRRRRRLHGRRPGHRPAGAAAPGRARCSPATATWPSAAAWRAAPASSAAPSGSSSRAATTSSSRWPCATASSDAQCGFKAVTRQVARASRPARGRRPVVLRHRAAGARRTQRPAHPRGAGRLDGRPRLPGGHRAHRDGRPQGNVADDRACAGRAGTSSRCPPASAARSPALAAGPAGGGVRRFVRGHRRFLKFAAVGAVNTAVTFAVFNLSPRARRSRPRSPMPAAGRPASPTPS